MKRKSTKRQPRVPRSIRRLFPQVKHAEDATTPVEVTVKDSDCASAQSLAPNECAMARAAKRQYKADGVVIGIAASYIIRGDTAVRYLTPASVAREVTSFDRHHDFAPGTYKLAAVSPARRLGAQQAKRSGPRKQNRIVHAATARVRQLEAGG